ncbi:MAG TPA: hypothetical protein VHK27_02130, partial [Gammaproteobacteria bacterium]|nr:hypothetical protein [Gammaproteobacteria bacterium]
PMPRFAPEIKMTRATGDSKDEFIGNLFCHLSLRQTYGTKLWALGHLDVEGTVALNPTGNLRWTKESAQLRGR